jgi:phosphate transport system protein
MVFDFFRRSGGDAIDDVEMTLVAMLSDARVVFDTAADAVFGGGKSKETKNAVRSTDRGINISQMEIRRTLMIHASVTEGFDLPLVLTYMSVVKDVERVGDYAKNLYDLARYGVDFTTADDLEELETYREAVGRLIDDAADTFEHRDADRAEKLIAKADTFLAEYDKKVKDAYRSDGAAADAVARALYYRYLKRITAHLMNLMTALVKPIDQLDYYDEAPEDR